MKKKLALIMAMMLIPASLMGCGQGSAAGAAAEPASAESTVAADAGAETTEGGGAYVFLDEDLGVESYAIGFRVGDEELAETVSGAVEALVLNGTYDKIGEKYPDIKDYLCLKADDIDESTIPAEGSGDPSFVFKQGFDLDYPPYSYRQDDATVGGFDVELCQAVCDYLGWGYEPVPFMGL